MAKVTRKRGRAEIKRKITIGLMKGLFAWGGLASQRAGAIAPVKSGRLARSIHQGSPFELTDLVWAVLFGTNVKYARAHEFGSGIHSQDPSERELILIEAKNAKALAFFWPGGPKDSSAFDPETGLFFFKRVFHPGVPAKPYLRPAAKDTKEDGAKLVMAAVKAELTR